MNKKIVLVGLDNVGKTSLLSARMSLPFNTEHVETFEEQYTSPNSELITYTDTNGSSDFDRLRNRSYVNASYFILCYSIENERSFSHITETFLPEIKYFSPGVSYSLVALKLDLRPKSRKTITTKQGESLSLEIGADGFYECSAFTKFNVHEMFDRVEEFAMTPASYTIQHVEILKNSLEQKQSMLSVKPSMLSMKTGVLDSESSKWRDTRTRLNTNGTSFVQLSNLVKTHATTVVKKFYKDASQNTDPIEEFYHPPVSISQSTQTETDEYVKRPKYASFAFISTLKEHRNSLPFLTDYQYANVHKAEITAPPNRSGFWKRFTPSVIWKR